MEAYIFRFVSLLGERYTHGHVFDFYRQLREHPGHLKVLGDGSQKKSYLWVGDCVRALRHAWSQGLAADEPHRVAIFNLGVDGFCQVRDSIGWICEAMGVQPELELTGGKRGWVGDNPLIYLATDRIRATGWEPTLTIRQGVERTVEWLRANEWVFDKRAD
jgi:UDP-glucose 4-epimerase